MNDEMRENEKNPGSLSMTTVYQNCDSCDRVIICQGCENECEVSIAFRNGQAVCLGGNNCPTGECYALAQARMAAEREAP